METKVCSRCNIEKSIDEYYKRTNGAYVCSYCKDCVKEEQKTIRKVNNDSGMCTICRKNVVLNGNYRCEDCKAREKVHRYKRASKKFSSGLCSRCGKYPLKDGCKRCCRCLLVLGNFTKNEKERVKFKVFSHYGLSCSCCGESNFKFLTIDHIDGGGAEHRRKIGQNNIYRWLVKNNFPDWFQTLCWNCNSGREVNGGICPHKEQEAKVYNLNDYIEMHKEKVEVKCQILAH